MHLRFHPLPKLSPAPLVRGAIERAEASAWEDLYRAAHPRYRQMMGLDCRLIGSTMVLSCQSIPLGLFNRSFETGIAPLFVPDEPEMVFDYFRSRRVGKCFILRVPTPLTGIHFGVCRWDRVYRSAEETTLPPADNSIHVVEVDDALGDAWAKFVSEVYHCPIRMWLREVVGRAGWRHYVVLREGHIVASRSMFAFPGEIAWLGLAAPVPGTMARTFPLDHALCHRMIRDALEIDCAGFCTAVEQYTPSMESPQYRTLGKLGFSQAYLRSYYTFEFR